MKVFQEVAQRLEVEGISPPDLVKKELVKKETIAIFAIDLATAN